METPKKIQVHDESRWTLENRFTLMLMTTIYPLWGLLFSTLNFPDTTDSISQRCVLGGYAAVILLLSYGNSWVRAHLMSLTTSSAILTTSHYFYLVHLNHMHQVYSIGAFVTVFSISSNIHRIRDLVIYSLVTLGLSIVASMDSDLHFQLFFVFGIATALLVTYVGSAQRLKQIGKVIEAKNIIADQHL